MSFRLVPKSATLNDLERRSGPYFALFYRIRLVASGGHSVKVVEDVVVKKFTFAKSSPDEFLACSSVRQLTGDHILSEGRRLLMTISYFSASPRATALCYYISRES